MTRAIVTFGTGRHAEMLEVALPSFRAFAARHGYRLFVADQIGTKRPPPWYKVKMLQQALVEHDAALWIDADVVIVDGTEDWPVTDGYWQSMVKHITADGEVPNSGIWYARKEMLPWLDLIWKQQSYTNHGWWEQAAVMHLMGYDPASRPCRKIRDSQLHDHTLFVDPGWNVHAWDVNETSHPRFQHATMRPDPLAWMRQWAIEAQEWM